jgi:hypothetical protein
MARPPIKKRQLTAAVERAANIDTTGMDPEMVKTIRGEAARRVGAAGVGVRSRDPFAGIKRGVKKLFGRNK